MAAARKSHFVFITAIAWGHLRPECALAVAIVRKFPTLTISFLVNVDIVQKSKHEMARHCNDAERDTLLSSIRVIGVGEATGRVDSLTEISQRMFVSDNMTKSLPAALATIMQEETYIDGNNISWPTVGCRPTLLIADAFRGQDACLIRETYHVPVLIWAGATATVVARFTSPVLHGGRLGLGEDPDSFEDANTRNERSLEDVQSKTTMQSGEFTNDIIRVKGLPLHYQWEESPQVVLQPVPIGAIIRVRKSFVEADGLLLPTVADLELEGLAGLEAFYCHDGKHQVFALGPQLPNEYYFRRQNKTTAVLAHSELNTSDDPCLAFLDNAQSTLGNDSAIYITFGSYFFPAIGHICVLLDVLLTVQQPMPFILSAAGASTPLPSELLERIEKSGRGLVVPWAPQQAILSHPALGWVLSHCGANGTFESLSQGVPMIAWPVTADQPMMALWLCEVLDAGFELLQVRTGPGAQKAYRGGPNGTEIVGTEEAIKAEMEDVLSKCRGEDGLRKRRNAQRAREIILRATAPGGQVEEHMQRLSQYL